MVVLLILIYFLIRGGHRTFSSPNQIGNHSPNMALHQPVTINSKQSYSYNLMLTSNELSSLPNHLPRTSTQSILETNSSTNEDDTLILQCSTSSNDDDYQHDLNSTDNDESHTTQYQQILTPTSTFIYV